MKMRMLMPNLVLLLGVFGGLSTGGAALAGPAEEPGAMPPLSWQARWHRDGQPADEGWEDVGPAAGLPSGARSSDQVEYRAWLPKEIAAIPVPAVLVGRVRYQIVASVDGREVHRFGFGADRSRFLGFPPHLFRLVDGKGEPVRSPALLELQVYSPDPRIGLGAAPVVADYGDLLAGLVRRGLPGLVIGGFLLLLGFSSAILSGFGFVRGLRNFSGLSFCTGLFVVLGADALAIALDRPFVLDNIQAAGAFGTLFFGLRTIRSLVPGMEHSILRLADRAALACLAVFPVLGASNLLRLPRLMPIFQGVAIFGILVHAFSVVRLAAGVRRARVLAIGFCILGGGAIHDILLNRGVLTSGIPLLAYAALGLYGAVAWLTGAQVQEELDSNATLKRDLQLAALVQESFMQQGRIDRDRFRVMVTTRQAATIGGDWYHYHFDQDYLHFHIGDISGHGPQAALGACYVKGLADAFYSRDPGRPVSQVLQFFHGSLHESLVKFEGGVATMTLDSVVVDLKGRRYLQFSSGHPSLLLVDPGTKAASEDRGARGTLLGLQGVPVDVPRDLDWAPIPDAAMIFLHTDGMYLLRGPDGTPVRNLRGLRSLLLGIPGSSASGMHEAISRLSASGDNPSIDDDLTLVSIEVFARDGVGAGA